MPFKGGASIIYSNTPSPSYWHKECAPVKGLTDTRLYRPIAMGVTNQLSVRSVILVIFLW